ncbi:MAG TPA: carboxypeptidase regulatory-like domain-containing protein [Pyrinomonadaceae bacterium]|nr:carboxypeptidase regulatory-like domain-containing protein [Pyrinomonadaceae bacterium]
MFKATKSLLVLIACFACLSISVFAQTTGSLSGQVKDEKGAILPNASVTLRNVRTNLARTTQADDEGRYRFPNVAVGEYEVSVEAGGFAKHVQTGVSLLLNQDAVVDVSMQLKGVQEVVNVVENASLLNTSTAEVGTRFDERRLTDLPVATNRSVYNLALSAPGVSQLGPNQVGFAAGINYSANGGRVRSNNFMIDGQDNNDFGVAGASIPLNNPDVIQEVRLVTNQFTAEFGRNSSSVFNAITKRGGNSFHGSGFWFHNSDSLNACSNLDKNAGFCNRNSTNPSQRHAPFRIENQAGGTIGGPILKNKLFFFGSLQRWWDRQLGSGVTIVGVPTEAGRAILQTQAGARPQVAALLAFLPAAQTAASGSATFNIGANQFIVPTGSLTGSTSFVFNDWQTMQRIDYNFNSGHQIFGRYIFQDSDTVGTGQASPPGNTSNNIARTQGLNITLASVLGPNWVNEGRFAWLRSAGATTSNNPDSETIPSIEINQLGLQGFNAAASRTAIGLGVNLPQFSFRTTWQYQDNLSHTAGNHGLKFGFDIHRSQLEQLFKPTTRGRLVYTTLNRFVNDVAQIATINKDLPGVAEILNLDWHDFYFYGQDEWKIRPNFTLTYGLRWELPGQPIGDLVDFNAPVVAAANGDARFIVSPIPSRDKKNFQPRIGFNWNPRTSSDGMMGFLTGGDRLVIRGGYSRTHDYTFTNIALNIWSSFPFVAAATFPTASLTLPGETAAAAGTTNAFTNLANPSIDPKTFARTVVSDNFHSPRYDSFSFEMQRELGRDTVLRWGYVGSKGSDLFQTIDGNPRRLNAIGCTAFVTVATDSCRVDSTASTIRLRTNSASSIYHSMQVSMEKRFSKGFSSGLHYTWSSFIDEASEIFNPSPGEIAIPQDSFNPKADRSRSTFDRPHRVAGNFVYELPWYREQKGLIGHVLGGWQINSSFSLQSGAPFTPLNGLDPTGALSGIDTLVGNAIRPNVYSNLDISRMSVQELRAIDQALRAQALQQAQQIFASIVNPQVGPLGGSALPNTLFTISQGRIVSNAAGVRSVVVDFIGLPTGRVGNAGRNILRADGINNIDLGILKTTRLGENQKLQLRADFYNFTNTRDFGIPQATVTNAGFLNQWGTNGGNRRVVVALRYVF